MEAKYKESIEWLKKNKLYDTFVWLAKGSVTEVDFGEISVSTFEMEEACRILISYEKTISKNLAESRVKQLIFCGLFKYKNLECDTILNADYTTSLGTFDEVYERALVMFSQNDIHNEPIQLSVNANISGKDLYCAILQEDREKQMEKELEEAFSDIQQDYIKYIDNTKKELEEKIKDIENGTIKSIEVISIFTAVISLFLSNIIGIMNHADFGLTAILIMNASVVVCIFFLLLFVRLLISNQKNLRFFIASVLALIVFLGITAILIA